MVLRRRQPWLWHRKRREFGPHDFNRKLWYHDPWVLNYEHFAEDSLLTNWFIIAAVGILVYTLTIKK